MVGAIILIVIFVLIFLCLAYKYPHIRVVGNSMYPTFTDGQILLAKRVSKYDFLTENRVYVYQSPSGDVVIKRLEHISPYGLYFVGDNTQGSFDSRSYGYVPRENVIAEIIINP